MKQESTSHTAWRAAQRLATSAQRERETAREQQAKESARSRSSFFGAQGPAKRGAQKYQATAGIGGDNFHESSPGELRAKYELKPHEKRAIVSQFLHNDDVFLHLCEMMFPAGTEGRPLSD